MVKKKFIDKKKSATFQLLARDSSDPNYDDSPGNDRVFVRVDNNYSYSTETFIGDDNEEDEDPNSIFADAPEENGDAGEFASSSSSSLPENVRKEILELGFPDDGYNYLSHMREIKNIGGFFNNPKTRLDQVPSDVKAYDASKLRISEPIDDGNQRLMYNVASETVGVRVQRAVDPEVAALLDDDDLSRFGSDIEDLEEDFVVQANFSNGECVSTDKGFVNLGEQIESKPNNSSSSGPQIVADLSSKRGYGYQAMEPINETDVDKSRVRRPLDEQFDLLESQEYGSDDDDEGGDDHCYIPEEDEALAEKLKNAFNGSKIDDTDPDGNCKYLAPADLLHANDDEPNSTELVDSARDVIRRCMEYGEKYQNDEGPQDEVLMFEESSDESEVWDCETIVSTYSNLDNHPGQIQAPGLARKKKLSETVSGALNSASNPKIVLKGREKMPVEFLPYGKKTSSEKVKSGDNLKAEPLNRKQLGQETKEEKKERKAAVKEERREARKVKKEMKGIYKGEAQRAQRIAAISCQPSIHLM